MKKSSDGRDRRETIASHLKTHVSLQTQCTQYTTVHIQKSHIRTQHCGVWYGVVITRENWMTLSTLDALAKCIRKGLVLCKQIIYSICFGMVAFDGRVMGTGTACAECAIAYVSWCCAVEMADKTYVLCRWVVCLLSFTVQINSHIRRSGDMIFHRQPTKSSSQPSKQHNDHSLRRDEGLNPCGYTPLYIDAPLSAYKCEHSLTLSLLRTHTHTLTQHNRRATASTTTRTTLSTTATMMMMMMLLNARMVWPPRKKYKYVT